MVHMSLRDWLESTRTPVPDFATRIGVHRVTLYRYIAGTDMPRPATVARIEAGTGGAVTVADLHAGLKR